MKTSQRIVPAEQESRRQLAVRIATENHFRWVDHRDENDFFPPAPVPEAMDDAIAMKMEDFKLVKASIDHWFNQEPVSPDADFVGYP